MSLIKTIIGTYFIPFYDDELKQQYYVVQLEQELAKGTAELEIEWTGDLTGTLVGINKVTYTDGGKFIPGSIQAL